MTDTTDAAHGVAPLEHLLDRAVRAANRGDLVAAHDLAEQVLAHDASNRDAAALLAVETPSSGELRRLSLLFCDLVGSTELSARLDPELYRVLVGRYKDVCRTVIAGRYHGHVSHIAGDGMLAAFGLPTPHENDAERAVRAALDIIRDLRVLSVEVEAAVGERLEARTAVHQGLVYFDSDEDEVYGLAANVTARLHGLGAPGEVIVSEQVQAVVGALFETIAEPPQTVKGVVEPLRPFRVVAERPEAPSRGRPWTAPLVGRSTEIGVMRDLWRRVRDGGAGDTGAVHLMGEAGIGKSRLVAALADEARAGGAACVELLGSPFHADAGFHPVRALVDGRCGLARDLSPAERLARLSDHLGEVGLPPDELVPLLAPVLDIPPEAGYRAVEADSRLLREAVAGGAARYLSACLGAGPGLLVVDDLHWCDESTIDTVSRVLHTQRGLLVVTCSREAAPTALGAVATVSLAPLDDSAAHELVLALLPELDERARRAVVDRGDGVPLFLEELARGTGPPAEVMVDLREPSEPSTASPVPGPVAPPTAPRAAAAAGPHGHVPEALYEPLVARLYSTGRGVRVAGAAATIGRDVERGVLARAVDLPEPELEAALAALLGEAILEPAPGDGDRYRFRHELLRVVAYDLQPRSRRRDLHGQVADALVDESGPAGAVDWRLVASHYDAACRPSEAVGAYGRAADLARGLGGLAEARSLLSRAIELVADLPDSPDRRSAEVGLRLRRGYLVASAEGNGSPQAVHDYERCLELDLADIAGDDMFSTLIPLFGYYMVRGDLARAEEVVEVLRNGLAAGREHYRPDNEAAFGMIHWYAGRFTRAQEELESSVAGVLTRRSSPDYTSTYFMPNDAPASAHANLALARFMGGDVRGADEQVEAARRRCRAIDFPRGPFSAAQAESYAAWMLIERGDLPAARAAAAAVSEIGDRHGFDLWALIGATEVTTVEAVTALAGTPDDRAALGAHAEAIEGLCAVWTAGELALFLPFFTATAARLRAASGDADGALAGYDETLRFAAVTGIHFYDAEVMRLRSRLLPDAEAAGTLTAALDLARAQHAVPFELRIAADLVARGGAGAHASLDAAVEGFPADAHYSELDTARSALAGGR